MRSDNSELRVFDPTTRAGGFHWEKFEGGALES
jgi:hypothetical protein